MNLSELITSAYSTSISSDVVDGEFKRLCSEHNQKWDDFELRTTPTQADLNRVYTI